MQGYSFKYGPGLAGGRELLISWPERKAIHQLGVPFSPQRTRVIQIGEGGLIAGT